MVRVEFIKFSLACWYILSRVLAGDGEPENKMRQAASHLQKLWKHFNLHPPLVNEKKTIPIINPRTNLK